VGVSGEVESETYELRAGIGMGALLHPIVIGNE